MRVNISTLSSLIKLMLGQNEATVGHPGSARLKRHCPSYCPNAKSRHVRLGNRLAHHGGVAPTGHGTGPSDKPPNGQDQQQLHKHRVDSPPDRCLPSAFINRNNTLLGVAPRIPLSDPNRGARLHTARLPNQYRQRSRRTTLGGGFG